MSQMKIRSKLNSSQLGYMKVSLQSIRLSDKFSSLQAQLVVESGKKTQEPFKIVFEDQFSQLNMFYTFASSPTDEITFKINFDDKEHIVGFAKFPIMKICQIAKVRHSLEIEMIDKKKFETDKEICVLAIVQIQMLYIIQTIGVLQFLMIEAKLERDTEVVGKMDPYIKLSIDGQQFKTGVRNNEGKHPIWNSKFKIPINSVKSELKVQVFDEDITSDDLVGEKTINLLEQQFLRPSRQLKKRPIYIFYEGKAAGVVNLESRFIIDEF